MPQRVCSLVIFLLLSLTLPSLTPTRAYSRQQPTLSDRDRVRLAEAFRLAEEVGNKVWRDWDKAPFAVLLVTAEHEFLIRHPKPTNDFSFLKHDSLLKSDIYVRRRVFQPDLLATFPAVAGVSCIVIGQAENTEAKRSTRWVLTMLHEHFHQLQTSQPSYYPDVEALNLAQGDKTGMWMLNYPFPYYSAAVSSRFSSLCTLLYDALRSRGTDSLNVTAARYLRARREFQKTLAHDDYRYFSFQLWQEGVARYTEYRLSELAARGYQPGSNFGSLPDFTSFESEADSIYQRIVTTLPSLSLSASKRLALYPFGAAEALLLDALNPTWRSAYLKEKFYLETYFKN